MNKRTMRLLRILSVFCVLMAIGASRTSILSSILMLIVSLGCLPGMQLALNGKVSVKFRVVILVVLTVLALTISNAALTEESGAEGEPVTPSASDSADASAP